MPDGVETSVVGTVSDANIKPSLSHAVGASQLWPLSQFTPAIPERVEYQGREAVDLNYD